MSKDKLIGRALTMGVTISVNIVNSILKILVRTLVDMIGYDTDSERVSTIMVVTFISALVNTAIIPLFTNANLAYVPLFRILPFRMNYSDLDESWYLTIGTQIVRTIMIQSFMPFISFLVSWGMRKPKQWLDAGLPCCPKVRDEEMPEKWEIEELKAEWRKLYPDAEEDKFNWRDYFEVGKVTNKVTIQQYVDLYAGPDFMIYSQYSFALVIIYTTFLYGLFMPILFIICFIGLFNMQLVDNLALTYYYQKPPMYDGALNDKAYNILVMAPCSMFLFGYWAMSNAQMFLNIPPERAFTNRSPNPKHELIDLNHGLNQGLLALFIFAFWLFKIFWVSIGQPLIDCCFKKDEN